MSFFDCPIKTITPEEKELVEKCGTKFVTEDEDGILTTYTYKGNFYFTEYLRKDIK